MLNNNGNKSSLDSNLTDMALGENVEKNIYGNHKFNCTMNKRMNDKPPN